MYQAIRRGKLEGGLVRQPEEPTHGDVLVELRPVNAVSLADESPRMAVLIGGVPQTRKPLQRNRQRPAILERENQSVFTELNARCPRLLGDVCVRPSV